MPRGRHRHSPPLHRLLPPTVIAGVPLVCAGAAWLSEDPLVLRGVAAAAAAAAVVGAVVMRRWDRLAGKRVADLTRGAASERWRHEEAVAELEGDLDESRELRTRLEGKLRAKRAELAALRGEHAALLRRYANAETERASALEGRRRLAIEAAAPARALPPVPPAVPGRPTPEMYRRANVALKRLARPEPAAPAAEEADSRGKSEAAAGHFTVPAAAMVVPAAPTRKVPQGGFDFFGAGLSPQGEEDLADVVGEELAAEVAAEVEVEAEVKAEAENSDNNTDDAETPEDAEREQQVIDLTAHDETEQIDMGELRSALQA
ncbi:hypothetical protein [Streptomyces endophyticus]|uniref:Secreted protein n=1 Tax=Streptomyces endophyticus TaxID=714166 RepID=A0ABU6FC23_9ACTN|nr:hypothetical protein [Streptomyces endophyticus]MEB8341023.1 hypothetical protein [Streptomyces endophyticus]